MRKPISFFSLMLMAFAVSAQTSVTVDGIKYNLDGSNAIVTYPTEGEPGSSNPNTYTSDITIPPSINVDGTDYKVTAIGKKAFRSSTITSLSLPEGLLSIGDEAICKTNITEITVPNSVTTLGKYAIGQNSDLTKITFGEHIADNNWGKWVAWRSSGAYEVYMICDTKPTLPDNYTFDDTHASTIFVKPSVYDDYMADPLWNIYNIVKLGIETVSPAFSDSFSFLMIFFIDLSTNKKPFSIISFSFFGRMMIDDRRDKCISTSVVIYSDDGIPLYQLKPPSELCNLPRSPIKRSISVADLMFIGSLTACSLICLVSIALYKAVMRLMAFSLSYLTRPLIALIASHMVLLV